MQTRDIDSLVHYSLSRVDSYVRNMLYLLMESTARFITRLLQIVISIYVLVVSEH